MSNEQQQLRLQGRELSDDKIKHNDINLENALSIISEL